MVDFAGPIYDNQATHKPKYAGPAYPQPVKPNLDENLKGLTDALHYTLDQFWDTASFGLYNDLLDATVGPMTGKKPGYYNEATQNVPPEAKVFGETLGYLVPGIAAEKAIAKGVPALAKNTWAATFGRNAAASGSVTAVDDAIREGKVDPMGILVDAGIGGAVGTAVKAASHIISPGARVRATGNELTEADRAAAKQLQLEAQAQGYKLDDVEALRQVAAARVGDTIALQNSAVASPAGSRKQWAFDEARRPAIEASGQRLADDIGGTRDPVVNSAAAREAIDTVGQGFQSMSIRDLIPLFHKKVAPSHIPRSEAYGEAASKVMDDPVMVEQLTKMNNGKVVEPNSILMLDTIGDELANKAAKAPNQIKTDAYGGAADDISAIIERFKPGYQASKDIAKQGKQVVSDLEKGPLGQIAGSSKVKTQSNALYGSATQAEEDAAREALKLLPADTSRGILANTVDRSVSKKGPNFAQGLLDDPHSSSLADEALSGTGVDIESVLRPARAVGVPKEPVTTNTHAGPFIEVWARLRNMGKGRVTTMLQDPKWIDRLGKMGILQQVMTEFGIGAGREIYDNTIEDPMQNYVPIY